jgi:Holliday junction DNA helicase RuvA
MIGKLTGKIDSIHEDSVILDVNGVGYGVFVSGSTLLQLRPATNNIISLFIETHVREDHIHLYGFLNIEEKTAFNLLQTVSGIGAKVALNILSYLTPEQIQNAVDTKDKTIFTSISGIGPKLAERMILELKGKKFSANAYIAATSKALQDNNIVEEAAGALSNLGINKQEAVNIVKNILQNDPNSTIDQVIRTALQNRNTK